ncbi:MAG: four helix bundle protein [Fimbriimonadales bacterium]
MPDFQETELWQKARDMVREAYRVTGSWPDSGGPGLASDVRSSARMVAKSVPRALEKRVGPTGNLPLILSLSNFSDLEVLCAIAIDLGYASEADLTGLIGLVEGMKADFKVIAKAAREVAKERRSKMFGMDLFDEDED